MGFVVSGLSGLGSSSFSGRRVSVGRRSVACVGRGRVGSLAGLSMIASFGPHRWEIGSEFEEDYEYTYLIDVPESLHDVTILDIDLRRMDLSMLKGKVVFVLNVASKDVKTDKFYRLLVDLYDRYHAQGLEIIAFPCNSFDQREPWANEEIKKFAHEKYGVQFYIAHKTFLDHSPVFCLAHKYFPGDIPWNFHGMFVFDRNGIPAERIPFDAPEELIELKIQEVLKRPYKASAETKEVKETTAATVESGEAE